MAEDMEVGSEDTVKNVTPLAKPPLRVAAFNIRILGVKKLKKKDVTHILIKIISRYDLVVIQEVRDSSQTAIDKLVRQLNTIEADDPFDCVESERLGRSNCKEQYVFLYRRRRLQVADTYQYDDGIDDGSDVFQREPFAVRFSSPTTELKDFGVIAIHTAPRDAVREIGALHTVYDVTKAHWKLADILIAGDFNADEGYVDEEDWCKIKLRTDRRFKWLIDDETDTTVGNTDRAYDRFVAVGKKLRKAILPGSAISYRFDDDLELSKDDAEDVSDHYPIELKLRGEVNRELQEHLSTDVSVVITQTTPVHSLDHARNIYRHTDMAEAIGFEPQLLSMDRKMHEVRAKRPRVQDPVAALREFQSVFPAVLSDDTVSMVAAYMTSSVMTSPPGVYGLVRVEEEAEAAPSFDVTVTVLLCEPHLCHVTVSRRLS
ncbi:deoxyribonuclease-1-like [Babylonia areolata]|uniref:deoxyribonuclease-1-like n=1 Tax=Babylonia areolata TaxID=304850 RepID=UPI003FD54E56